MTWNNRIFKHVGAHPLFGHDHATYAMHECHYDKDGKMEGYTADPMFGHFDSVEELIKSLSMMLEDAKRSAGDILDYK